MAEQSLRPAAPKAVYALPLEARQTLPSSRRIRQRAEFERVFRSPDVSPAQGISNKWFTIYIRKNDSGMARLGVIVSKRYLPTAVARNIAKRLIREVFRRNFPACHPLDVVVKTRRQFQPSVATESRLALMQLFQTVRM